MIMKNNMIIDLAIKSLVYEVSLWPKPGLVDPLDSGAHNDMDYYTFIDSCFALREGFNNYYDCGKNHKGSLKSLFDKIRFVGIENEKNMFSATANVNTHKGANFLYGVVIAAIAYCEYPTLPELQEVIKVMTKGLVHAELESLVEFNTHGEKVYRDYKIDGIRGEVERGIPSAFEIALPILRRNDDFDLAMKQALLKLIEINDDSNMLKRGGIEGLNYGQLLSKQSYEDINQHLAFMNKKFIEKNLSPGGSADLLALSIFLKMYEEEIIKGSHQF